MISATVAQLRRFGVAGTSVSGILEDSGLARRTLYLNFPAGKPELIAAATENASGITISAVEAMVSDSDPAQVVQTFADRWADSLRPMASPRVVRSSRRLWVDRRRRGRRCGRCRLRPMGGGGHPVGVGLGIDPEAAGELATTIVATVEGAVIMSMAECSAEPLRRAGRGLASLVRARLASQPR